MFTGMRHTVLDTLFMTMSAWRDQRLCVTYTPNRPTKFITPSYSTPASLSTNRHNHWFTRR